MRMLLRPSALPTKQELAAKDALPSSRPAQLGHRARPDLHHHQLRAASLRATPRPVGDPFLATQPGVQLRDDRLAERDGHESVLGCVEDPPAELHEDR